MRRSTAARRSPPTPDDYPHMPPETEQSPPPPPRPPVPPPPGTPSSPLNHRGPYQRPRPRHPSPPTTKGRGKGLRREAWRQAGRGYDRGERVREPDKTAAGGVGWGGGWEQAPRLGGRGEAPGDRAAGPEQRTTDDRPRQTGPGPAAGGYRQASGPPTGSRHPSRRTAREMRPEDPGPAVRGGVEGSRGRRHGKRCVVWGEGALSTPSPPPSLGSNLEGTWQGGQAEEGHRRRRHRARGKGAGAPGRGWRGGRAGGGEPPFPPDPHSAPCPSPSRAVPHPLRPERPPEPTARQGRAPPPRRLFLPCFPSRAARVQKRLRGGTRRGGAGRAMILCRTTENWLK